MQFFRRLFSGEQEQQQCPIKVESRGSDFSGREHFSVRIKPNGAKQEARFLSAISRPEAFTQPPQKIQKPNDLLTLERHRMSTRGGRDYTALVRPWMLQRSGVTFLGTEDHHELYYQLLQREKGETSPEDILFNVDAHDDVTQGELNPHDTDITIGDFVGIGFQETVRKTWAYYLLVSRPYSHSAGSDRNLSPENYVRLNPEHLLGGLKRAVELAKLKKSKVIITIDLDFFGCAHIVDFNPRESQRVLSQILQFVQENKKYIRLVHFTESLSYAVGGDEQISTLYQQLVQLLENFE